MPPVPPLGVVLPPIVAPRCTAKATTMRTLVSIPRPRAFREIAKQSRENHGIAGQENDRIASLLCAGEKLGRVPGDKNAPGDMS